MIIDLTKKEYKVFAQNSVEFNEGTTLIFGKNGTGKSTLTKLIIEQMFVDYDVRNFSGFDNILNVDGDLDIVILGDDNINIDKEIKEIEKEKEKIQIEIDKCNIQLNEENKDEESIIYKYIKCKKIKEKAEEYKESIIAKIAADIKNKSNPQISLPTYNKNNLKEEMQLIHELSDNDNRNDLVNKLKEEEKNAKNLSNFDYSSIENLTNEVNDLITKNISEIIRIDRFEKDNKEEKIRFAQNGLKLHKAGEVCAFCGNIIDKTRYDELDNYFKQSDIENLQGKLNEIENKISRKIDEINCINIEKDDFYLQYRDDIAKLYDELQLFKNETNIHLNDLNKTVLEKNRNLTKVFNKISNSLTFDYNVIKNKYDDIKRKNNLNNLTEEKEIAKKKLRLIEIKNMLYSDEYKNAEEKCLKANNAFLISKNKLKEEQKLLEAKNKELEKLELEIAEKNALTQNPNRIVDKINIVLENYVNFALEYAKIDNKGSYYIAEKRIDL